MSEIPRHTLDNLDEILEEIVHKFEKETGCQILIAYAALHGDRIDASVNMSDNLEFGSACKLSLSITECIGRYFAGDNN